MLQILGGAWSYCNGLSLLAVAEAGGELPLAADCLHLASGVGVLLQGVEVAKVPVLGLLAQQRGVQVHLLHGLPATLCHCWLLLSPWLVRAVSASCQLLDPC